MITEFKDICAICGAPKEEIHHLVFGTSGRQLAEEDGLKLPVCSKCHKEIHLNSAASRLSKIVGQLQFEQTGTREQFRQRYGRSFL